MKRKPLKELKVKSNMQFVYYDYETDEVVRVDAFGEIVGKHIGDRENSTKFLLGWLASYSLTENTNFIFLESKDDLKAINFRA